MPLKAQQLDAALRQGLRPVYLIGGPEPLLVQECRDKVIAAARAEGYTEREVLAVDRGFDWDALVASAGAPSLFAERKVIDLRLPTGKPGQAGAKALIAWCETPDADTLLVVSCDAWDAASRKSKWAAAFDRGGVQVDVWAIKPREMPGWVAQRLKAAGLEPEREAVMTLAHRLEGNLLAAQQEIEKLALIKGSGKVTTEDVLASVADSARFDAFVLVERILEGDTPDGLRIVAGLKRMDVPIQLVTGAIVRELRTLEAFVAARQAGEAEAAAFRKLNVWRSRQAAVRRAASRIDAPRLGQGLRRLSLIDRQSKGQADGDPWQELDRLVLALCA